MSGPKVVNIEAIRRQQRRECNKLLHELGAEVEEYLQLQNTHDVSGDSKSRAAGLIARLRKLQEADQWEHVRVETTAHRDFYKHEIEALRQQKIQRLIVSHRQEHRLRQVASQICAEISLLPSSPAIETTLKDLAHATNVESLQHALARASNLLAESRHDKLATQNLDQVLAAAAAYVSPESATTKPPVLPASTRDPDEVRLERCWTLLAELEIADSESVESWKKKAQKAAAASIDERSLLIDSLALELSSHMRNRRTRQAAMAAVQSALADLGNVAASTERARWSAKLNAAAQSGIVAEQALQLANAAREWLAHEIKREDAFAQRSAILCALTELGYEVREGMATAWTEEGRVVIHKPNESVYGLELSAPPTGPAFQVRVVAEGSPGRSKQRDQEVEQTWCGEFTRLQTILDGGGFPTRLAQAHAPGEIPIKVVPGMDAHEVARRSRQNRTVSRSNPK